MSFLMTFNWSCTLVFIGNNRILSIKFKIHGFLDHNPPPNKLFTITQNVPLSPCSPQRHKLRFKWLKKKKKLFTLDLISRTGTGQQFSFQMDSNRNIMMILLPVFLFLLQSISNLQGKYDDFILIMIIQLIKLFFALQYI